MQENFIQTKVETNPKISGSFMKIFKSLGLSTHNISRNNRLREVDELYQNGRLNNDEVSFARMLILDEF